MDRVLSVAVVARRLGVSAPVIYRAIRRRELTAIKAGQRRVVIEETAFERYLARRRLVAREEIGA